MLGPKRSITVSIYSKLWKGVKDGYGLEEKKKDGEGDRVCGKNEKSAERGWSSISKSTEGNENTNG